MVELLNVASTIALGVFAGALLTEAMILVPYWRKMAPDDFFRLHSEMGPSLFRYFAPLTMVTVFLAIAAAGASLIGPALSVSRIAAGGGAALTLLIFFLYFKDANQSFADRSLANEELKPELARWAAWHGFRTVIMITAFAASVVS